MYNNHTSYTGKAMVLSHFATLTVVDSFYTSNNSESRTASGTAGDSAIARGIATARGILILA